LYKISVVLIPVVRFKILILPAFSNSEYIFSPLYEVMTSSPWIKKSQLYFARSSRFRWYLSIIWTSWAHLQFSAISFLSFSFKTVGPFFFWTDLSLLRTIMT